MLTPASWGRTGGGDKIQPLWLYSRSLKASPLGVSVAMLNSVRGLLAVVCAMCCAERLGSRAQR